LLGNSNPAPYEDAVIPATHFQAVLGEVCRKMFGLIQVGAIDPVIPGYAANQANDPQLYGELGFLA
jgi:hypothetical protein